LIEAVEDYQAFECEELLDYPVIFGKVSFEFFVDEDNTSYIIDIIYKTIMVK